MDVGNFFPGLLAFVFYSKILLECSVHDLDTLWVHQSTQRNQRGHATPEPGEKTSVGVVGPLTAPGPHEYHEISSDEEELNGNISPGFAVSPFPANLFVRW